MSLQFARTKPFQAGKLAGIVGVLLFAAAGYFRLVPDRQLAAMLAVLVVGLGLAFLVAAETLLAGYRTLRVDGPLASRLTDRPLYAAVRAGEAAVAVLAAGLFLYTLGTLPDGPMPGPGAVGLLLYGFSLGLSVVGASLVRTLAEYYYHRQRRGVR